MTTYLTVCNLFLHIKVAPRYSREDLTSLHFLFYKYVTRNGPCNPQIYNWNSRLHKREKMKLIWSRWYSKDILVGFSIQPSMMPIFSSLLKTVVFSNHPLISHSGYLTHRILVALTSPFEQSLFHPRRGLHFSSG